MVRERMDSKEQEVLGQWFTEERMEKSGDFSKHLGLRLDPCSTVACDAVWQFYTQSCELFSFVGHLKRLAH